MNGFDVTDFVEKLGNEFLLQGVFVTLWLTAAAMAGGLLLGLGIALLRSSPNRVWAGAARFYIWLFRGTPLLIQLVIIYSGLPQIGLRLGVVASALVGLILNEAAYVSEVIRGGFMAIPAGQRDAAMALGLSRWKTMRLIVLPQAIRIILPAIGNSVNGLLKATSLTSVISMEELLRRSEMVMQVKFDVLEVFAAAAVYYLLLTTLWDLVQRRLEARFGRAYRANPTIRAALAPTEVAPAA